MRKRSPCKAVNWSRHGLELPPRYSPVAPRQRPYSRVSRRENFQDSDYWLKYVQMFQQTPCYLRPAQTFKRRDDEELPREQSKVCYVMFSFISSFDSTRYILPILFYSRSVLIPGSLIPSFSIPLFTPSPPLSLSYLSQLTSL